MRTTITAATPARTHAHANELLRRPFAPAAIGFRAMSKRPARAAPIAALSRRDVATRRIRSRGDRTTTDLDIGVGQRTL
jgi:hypothetical protein